MKILRATHVITELRDDSENLELSMTPQTTLIR